MKKVLLIICTALPLFFIACSQTDIVGTWSEINDDSHPNDNSTNCCVSHTFNKSGEYIMENSFSDLALYFIGSWKRVDNKKIEIHWHKSVIGKGDRKRSVELDKIYVMRIQEKKGDKYYIEWTNEDGSIKHFVWSKNE